MASNSLPLAGFLRTVQGDVPVAEIDRVLPHEHLLTDFSAVSGDRNHILNNPALAIHELETMKQIVPTESGKRHAIVEVTLPDFGRNPAGLRRIAASTDVAVVMGTGWYRAPFYPPDIARTSTRTLAERMISEIKEGVPLTDGTRVRAGVIGEIGTHGEFVDPAEERVLRAAAQASIATGAALTTHTFFYPVGLQQIEILEAEGIDPSYIAIGHVDTFLDIEYHREMLHRGVSLQFDTCGRVHLMPDELRAQSIVALLEDGWAERLLISSDRCHQSDMTVHGGVGYAWALAGFCDLLRDHGVDESTLRQITRDNPLRLFGRIGSVGKD